MARKKHQRPLRFDKSRHVKLESFYDERLIEEAELNRITVSKLIRRIVYRHVHIRMAKKKKQQEQDDADK